ncbi:hypothetical protein Zmor_023566 [Zophobas morio]|uniref:Uncharacterized protein n=1 Tax=Zophobas morio TaxID=2755281 RepID=A0AA38HYW0_9CUCU|nr:hypothetical protein Zmor_023566 [Zophobas morio]
MIPVPDAGLYLNLCVPLDGSRTPLREFSGPAIETSGKRYRLAFVERRVDTDSNDDSPINAVRTTRKLSTAIGVVPGRRGVRVHFVTINCHCYLLDNGKLGNHYKYEIN